MKRLTKEEKEEKIIAKVIRDEKGRIVQMEGFTEETLLIPFISDVITTIKKFDEDT